MINEAWGDATNYKRELENLINTYNDKRNKLREKIEKRNRTGKGYISRYSSPRDVLQKYPISILVDKLGYEIQKETVWRMGGKKERINKRNAAAFLADKLDNGEVTPEQLAEWWQEYSDEVNKKQYFDPEWIIKQIDPLKLFDPYDPDSTYKIDKFIENPCEIVNALNWSGYSGFKSKRTGSSILYGLSKDEKEQVINFYTEPTNQEMLHKLFLKAKNRFMKAKPTLSSSVERWLTDLFNNDSIEYDGCDIKKALEREREESEHGYYQGSNYRSEEAHAIVSVVTQALDEYYNLGITKSTRTIKNQYDEEERQEYRYAKNEDETTQRKFLKDAQTGIYIDVHKGERNKSEHSSVWNSSFFTYYKYDIDVKISVGRDNVVFEKTYEGVTLSSNYYSGGWN